MNVIKFINPGTGRKARVRCGQAAYAVPNHRLPWPEQARRAMLRIGFVQASALVRNAAVEGRA